GPTIRWLEPGKFKVPVVSVDEYAHPVATVDPSVNLPLSGIVTSWPELPEVPVAILDPESEPPEIVKLRPLRAWSTFFRPVKLFLRVMVSVLPLAVNGAVAFTESPPFSVAPANVLKVCVAARAAGGVTARASKATPVRASAARRP